MFVVGIRTRDYEIQILVDKLYVTLDKERRNRDMFPY